MCTHNLCFEQKKREKYHSFSTENCHFDGCNNRSIITITRLCNILLFFTTVKKILFRCRKSDIFSYFCSYHKLLERVPTIFVLEQT